MRLSVAVAAALALALSACQDPAGVGLGLIDEDQADPSVRVVPLAELDTLTVTAPAIGIADPNNPTRPQGRVLVGDVRDAVFGDARSIAYVDALQPADATRLDADDVLQVWLQLPRTYVYGDTTTALPVELRAVQGSWDALPSYPADTVFAVGPTLTTAALSVADTLSRFDLPASWVRANAATLVGDSFADDFEGFSIQTAPGFVPSPGAVFGLDTFPRRNGTVGLRVATSEDTLTFPLSEVFSSIATTAPTAAPSSILPVRRGSGADVRFTADLSAIGPVPLARAVVRLPLDQSYAEVGTFVRPIASQGALFGVRDSDGTPERTLLADLTSTDGGDFSVADSPALTRILQTIFATPSDAGFDRYEIRPTRAPTFRPASLDILPVIRPVPGAERPPRFVLTVVGTPAS